MPRVTVVIPCYNQGVYLDEAVNSVLAQSLGDLEIIIVNDGSTDQATNAMLAEFQRPLTRVITTANQGLAMARNTGIAAARGEYILPLDADDRIGPDYLARAVAVLDSRPRVGIVYCRAETFGAENGPWPAPDFSMGRMLLGNLIFCSALFRRSDWQQTHGYDPGMIHGWEDWDFWLSLLELGREVCRLPDVHFYYRVKEGSMASSMTAAHKAAMHRRIMANHPRLFPAGLGLLVPLYYRVTGSLPYRFLKRLRRTMGRGGCP